MALTDDDGEQFLHIRMIIVENRAASRGQMRVSRLHSHTQNHGIAAAFLAGRNRRKPRDWLTRLSLPRLTIQGPFDNFSRPQVPSNFRDFQPLEVE